jgi:predicted aspartyl protease
MLAYDASRFDPPAPIGLVTLRNPDTGSSVTGVSMLVDTGADVTLIPRIAADSLGLVLGGEEYELMGFDGSRSVASAVRLSLVLFGKTFRGRFLLVDQEWGILGRDILNHLTLLFDGPRQSWGDPRSSSS